MAHGWRSREEEQVMGTARGLRSREEGRSWPCYGWKLTEEGKVMSGPWAEVEEGRAGHG